MPQQLLIGNFTQGLTLDRLPFNIDNNAFPYLFNFYIWRGRAKRKRGTIFLGRLQRQISVSATPAIWQQPQFALVGGSGNLIVQFSLGATSSITPKSISFSASSVPNVIFTDALADGNLYESATITGATQANPCVLTANNNFSIGQMVKISGVVGMTQLNGNTYTITNASATTITINVDSTGFGAYVSGGIAFNTSPFGTINYTTGAFTITGGGAGSVTGTFSYYPGLPVMGLRNLAIPATSTQYPALLAFDTVFAYQIQQTSSQTFFYSVSYYRGSSAPVVWSGQDYQQFWTTNYSSSLWATNGKSGFHFVNGTYTSGSGTADIVFNFKSGGVNYTKLVIGDQLWFNEWNTGGSTINGLVGTVSDVTGAAAGNYTVHFSMVVTVAGTGIAELLTNSIPGQDGIKWYDGDPTGATGLPVTTATGWSNFAPPLTATAVSINNTPARLYYLVGALMIVPFKDRLLFFGPQIQSSDIANPIQLPLQDTVIWSWNGTPYYANAPAGETTDPTAYYVDETGKGGWLSAGIAQAIVTVNNNEDVLLVGFTSRATRFVYTSNDLDPFGFYSINSELGDSATFSGITLDRGAITIGTYGISLTSQVSKSRIDLQIPDEVFRISSGSDGKGTQRINSARDFFREWIYFSYPIVNSRWRFPTQSFFYNYREETWAAFYENFTTHGTYRQTLGYTWSTIPFLTWSQWNESWNSGFMNADFSSIVGGNPQGFVLIKGEGTGEGQSGNVAGISNNAGNLQINSIDHCVTDANPGTGTGDYLVFNNFIGTVAPSINMKIAKVIQVVDANNFVVDIPFPSGTYLGLGVFTRLSQPYLQTKQFNPYWETGRKVRIGIQKYLMDRTATSSGTVQIFLSQDPDNPWTNPPIVPLPNSTNNSLIYSEVLYTAPETQAIGLTAANINLQMPIAGSQRQIWHRSNTSLIGDTFQIGLTLNDAQMRSLTDATAEFTCHGMQFLVSEGPLLS